MLHSTLSQTLLLAAVPKGVLAKATQRVGSAELHRGPMVTYASVCTLNHYKTIYYDAYKYFNKTKLYFVSQHIVVCCILTYSVVYGK